MKCIEDTFDTTLVHHFEVKFKYIFPNLNNNTWILIKD